MKEPSKINQEAPVPESVIPVEPVQEKTDQEQWEEERTKLKDQLLRNLADLENFRKRAEREREEALKYGVTKFAKDFLTVLDAFQKALHVSDEAPSSVILEGLRIAEKEFSSTLNRHGVKSIPIQKGDTFDPAYHQAMLEIETTDYPAGCIVEILQTGYTLQERLLRPALVGVSKSVKL
jgi:molecular chaperone GrpE